MNEIHQTTAPAPENARSDQHPAQPGPSRAATRRSHGDRYIRAGAVVVVLLLAGVAAYVSYRHQLELAVTHGEPQETARLIPITIDGVIVMASLVMLYCARLTLPVPRLAYLALWSGIGATLAANAAHGWPGGWTSRLISAAPAAVLVIAYELLMWLIRTMRKDAPVEVAERVVFRDRPVEVEVPVEVRDIPADRFEAARWAYEDSLQAGRRKLGRRALADRWGLEQREAVEVIEQADREHSGTAPAGRPVEALAEAEVFHPEPPASLNGASRTGAAS